MKTEQGRSSFGGRPFASGAAKDRETCRKVRGPSRPGMLSPVAASRGAAPPLSPWTGRSPSSVTPDGAPPCHPGRSEAEIRGPAGRGPCRGVPAFLGPGSSPGRQLGGRDDRWGPGMTVGGAGAVPPLSPQMGRSPSSVTPHDAPLLVTPDGAKRRSGAQTGTVPAEGYRHFWIPDQVRDDKLGGRDDSLGEQGRSLPCRRRWGAAPLPSSWTAHSLVTPDGAERRSGVQEGAVPAEGYRHFWVPDQVRDDSWARAKASVMLPEYLFL